jgi:hypothetical protein
MKVGNGALINKAAQLLSINAMRHCFAEVAILMNWPPFTVPLSGDWTVVST